MKRFFCLLAAAFLLLAAGCAKNNTTEPVDVTEPSPTPYVRPADSGNSKKNEGAAERYEAEHAVILVDGRLDGSSYYWDLFLNKARNGLPGSVKIIDYEGEEKTVCEITKKSSGYTLKKDGVETAYSALAVFETAVSSGKLVIGVLTNTEGLTASAFFGGSVPEDLTLGFTNDMGTVVYIKAD